MHQRLGGQLTEYWQMNGIFLGAGHQMWILRAARQLAPVVVLRPGPRQRGRRLVVVFADLHLNLSNSGTESK